MTRKKSGNQACKRNGAVVAKGPTKYLIVVSAEINLGAVQDMVSVIQSLLLKNIPQLLPLHPRSVFLHSSFCT